MGKSNVDKLTLAIAATMALIESAVPGSEVGQYPQDAIDALLKAVTDADVVAKDDATEPSQAGDALETLNAAVQSFKEAEVKPPDDSGKNQSENQTAQSVSLKGVVLKGWEDGREGNHSLHLRSGRIVSFKDGKADLPLELADELKKDGYVE